MSFEGPAGCTPLDPHTLTGLIPDLKNQMELNEFEQMNIAKARIWASKSRRLEKEILSINSIKLLHQQMFDLTWTWAGTFRKTNINIGVPSSQILPELKVLCDDTKYQIEKQTYKWDELGARFHHRLVFIHPFLNGNGRHARLMTDLLLAINNHPLFTWGSMNLSERTHTRNAYIKALKEADNKNFKPLLKFVRS